MRILITVFLLLAVPAEHALADNWGCDWVPSFAVDDCGSKGACCDEHDALFDVYGCSAWSWFHTMCYSEGTYCYELSMCDYANARVATCIASENPGASACCDFNGHNVCGSERNPNSAWGCLNDSWCGAHSKCNVARGVCEPICENTTPTACGVSWTDSCGNTYTPIGCVDGMQCIDGRCQRVCTPYTCDDWYDYDPTACGVLDNGCGGTVECGCVDDCVPWTCDDYGGAEGSFWDGCYGSIECWPDDPWDPWGGGCEDSWYPSWCPYYCTDVEAAS